MYVSEDLVQQKYALVNIVVFGTNWSKLPFQGSGLLLFLVFLPSWLFVLSFFSARDLQRRRLLARSYLFVRGS